MERLVGSAGFPWWWHTRDDTVDKIDADSEASGALVGFMLNANKLAKASFTATYGRK